MGGCRLKRFVCVTRLLVILVIFPGSSDALARGSGDEMITLPRQVLKRAVDGVERASMAAQHAVRIATAARSAFEDESGRLAEVLRDLQRCADRSTQ